MDGVDTAVDCSNVEGVTTTTRVGTRADEGKRRVRVLDGYVGRACYGVHNASLRNLQRGVAERVLYTRSGGDLVTPIRPIPGVFGRLKPEMAAVVRGTRSTTVVDADSYASLYTGRKRAKYELAAASLQLGGITHRDAFVSTFVKAEKINFSAKPDPAPRVIQPRNPRYNLCLGRYLKPFEHAMVLGFKRAYGYNVVCKGLNAEGVAEQLRENWESYRVPVAVGLDASRFDQHVSQDALRFEHELYLRKFDNDPELRKLLSWQLVNRGAGWCDTGKVSYTVEGCRMSGDINTGMGNCFIMSAIVLGYLRTNGVDARLSNNGDDCVVFCESKDLHALSGLDEWFRDFGFKLTREDPVYEFERIEFCQAQPVLTGSGWRMTRNPYVATSKDMVSLLSWNTELEFDRWRGAISACGTSLSRGVPFWEAFYKSLGGVAHSGSSESIEDSGLGYMAKGVKGCSTITPESRYSFWLAFGMLPDEQIALENLRKPISYCKSRPMTFGDVTSLHDLLSQ